MPVRFEQLTYLDAALRLGSFRRAAIDLGVAQPTISAQVQRLEEDLGVVLVVRGAHGIQPTHAGEHLLPYLRAALRAEQSMRQEAGAISGVRSGRVRLGSIAAASQALLPRVVQRYRAEYPNIHLQVTEGGSGFVSEGVASGEFDAGVIFRLGPPSPGEEDLRYIDLAEGLVVIAVPAGHRLASRPLIRGRDLAGEPLIFFHEGSMLRSALERLTQGVEVKPVFYTTSAETAQRMVSAGVGLALTSTLAPSSADREGVALVRLAEPWTETRLSIVLRSGEQPTPAVQAFTRVLRDVASTEPPGAR